MSDVKDHYQKGLIGIASNTMGRYREFDISLNAVRKPLGSLVTWETGCDMAFVYSNMCRKLIESKELEWLWILGDDHVFKPDILMNLLSRNVDIVVPLCLKRSRPFRPVLYKVDDGQYYQQGFDYLKDKSGLLEVPAAGNAGMLVRRKVIEKIGDDWHRVGWQFPEHGGSDLYFCKRAVEKGFKIYVDLNNSIGHITHMALWPVKYNGGYSVGIREALDLPGDKLDKIEGVSCG